MKSSKKISIALWDDEFLAPYVDAFQQAGDSFDVVVTSADRCEQLALAGMVDVGLLRSYTVLLHEDDLEIYGTSAVSTWKFPHAKLALGCNLGEKIDTVEFAPEDREYALLSRIILNEHYHQGPSFVETPTPAISGSASAYVVSDAIKESGEAKIVLDLGQEWFELTGYPMVWGLLGTLKGQHTNITSDAIAEVAARYKLARGLEISSVPSDTPDLDFGSDLRVGYDDLAIASLTELSQYLYFYKVIEEPVTIPVIKDDD